MEARVAQLWFWEGFYSRYGVNLERYYQEPLLVTDLDLFAFDFTPHLAQIKHIGEVKSGTGKNTEKPLDRLVWLRGLRELVGADAAELTIAKGVTSRIRQLGRSLDVTAQSVEDFERREGNAVGKMADLGAHGVAALTLERDSRDACRSNADLDRAFKFLRGEVLFLEPFLAIKQLIDLLQGIGRHWTPRLQDGEARAVRWLAAEGVSILALKLVAASATAMTLSRGDWNDLVSERLAEGAVPMHQMRKISDAVDKYVAGVLSAVNVAPEIRTEAIGAFLPEPPHYAGSLAELCWRLKSDAPVARVFPRQLDLFIFERLVKRREIDSSVVMRLGLGRDTFGHTRRLIAAFLRSCDASFDELDQVLTSDVGAGSSSGAEFPAAGSATS
ncbi:hypothetical protein [Streptomyces sp. NBC_00268]|uniref:hypothetical protein n=1 Tax=Streptomyces sp. NBC_00268 TaxID=2975695 RepID=UPI00225418E8|nr:hypothetical protein [Streptomyces sp. NBC_00268]MCX5182575.1 hypothetical protein [Streptomyces sp. NBC_00268]